MTKDEIIRQLTDSLKAADELQNKYEAALDEMGNENKFLSDTIKQNKLGLITEERRKLLNEINQREADAQKIMEDAQSIKEEYCEKLERMTGLIQDLQEQKDDLDLCIENRAEKKIKDIKILLESEQKKHQEAADEQYQEKEQKIMTKLTIYRIVIFSLLGIIAISICAASVGIRLILFGNIVPLILMLFLIIRALCKRRHKNK